MYTQITDLFYILLYLTLYQLKTVVSLVSPTPTIPSKYSTNNFYFSFSFFYTDVKEI